MSAAIATLQTALTEVEGNSVATEAIQNAINSLQGEQKVSGDATMSDATINDATMSDAIIENANVGTGKSNCKYNNGSN